MSLTKQDLSAIGNLIDERLEVKLEEKLESKLEEKLESKLEEKLESKFEEKLKPIKNDLNSLKKGQKQIQKDLNMVIDTFDRELIYHNKCLNRLDNHLHLPPVPKTL